MVAQPVGISIFKDMRYFGGTVMRVTFKYEVGRQVILENPIPEKDTRMYDPTLHYPSRQAAAGGGGEEKIRLLTLLKSEVCSLLSLSLAMTST